MAFRKRIFCGHLHKFFHNFSLITRFRDKYFCCCKFYIFFADYWREPKDFPKTNQMLYRNTKIEGGGSILTPPPGNQAWNQTSGFIGLKTIIYIWISEWCGFFIYWAVSWLNMSLARSAPSLKTASPRIV